MLNRREYEQKTAVAMAAFVCMVCATCVCNTSAKSAQDYHVWSQYSEAALKLSTQNNGKAMLMLMSPNDINCALMKRELDSVGVRAFLNRKHVSRFIADVGPKNPEVFAIQESLSKRGFGTGTPMVLIYEDEEQPRVYSGLLKADRFIDLLRRDNF